MKQVAGSIKLELAQYREMEAFAQFGSDLDVATQQLLNRGARLTQVLKQPQYKPVPVEEQVVSIFAGVNGYLDRVKVEYVNQFENNLIDHCRNKQKNLLDTIKKDQEVKEATEKKLHDVIKSFLSSYKKEELIVEDDKDDESKKDKVSDEKKKEDE